MPKLLILGGTGHTGRLIAEHLLRSSDACVTIAARHPDRAAALADDLNRPLAEARARATYADASDLDSLRRALAGQDMAIVAAPTTAHAATVVQAALDCRVDYLDVQLGRAKLALLRSRASDIERAGACFITEAGFHPGLPSAMVRLAAGQMDALQRATLGGYLNMGRDLPYTEAVDELVEVFKDYDTRLYALGRWSRAGFFTTRRLDFGGDIGPKRAYPMFFEELGDLPEMLPSIQELGFYIAESHWVNDWLITPLVLLGLKVFPHAVRPIGRWLWWGMRTFHKPPYRVELMIDAHGVKHGKPTRFRASVGHPDGYQLTAIPVVAALRQILDGTTRRPGLWMMGHLVEPPRLMADMAAMGVEVTSATT
jgi:saccharopine dehydrogenase-like NADP-dependent oxidoreductase